MIRYAVVLIAWIAGLTALADVAKSAGRVKPRKIGLLAGCTKYPSLPESYQLQGPGNDVLLMRNLLIERFGFAKENLVILSEASGGEAKRPTRANIEREFQRLAEIARPGDQVVILLGGHGSQQPQKERPDPADMKPDGLSEIFLPADVGKWNGAKGAIENVIADYELHDWLQAIEDRGASIWILVDSCHSGTICRGVDDEVARQVPADFLVPEAAIKEAQQKAAQRFGQSRGGPVEVSPLNISAKQPTLVALYAAQPNEVTVEKSLPTDSPDRKRYGLLTFTVNQILRQAKTPLTYNELIQRIHAQYVEWGRTAPTPMIEGQQRDREVLGTTDWPGRSRIVLKDTDDGLSINAGGLLGVAAKSVLAVYPPAGQPRRERPVGYVQVTEARTLDASVEPCNFANTTTERKDLPANGVCELAFIDFGDMRLRVAVDAADHHGKPVPEEARKGLTMVLQKLAAEEGSMIRYLERTDRADWLLRWNRSEVYLVPASGMATSGKADALPPLFGPAPGGEQLAGWLQVRLQDIVRARNLVKLASDPDETARGAAVKVDVEFRLRQSKGDLAGKPLPVDGRGIRFYDQDRLGIRLRNPNSFAIDVTLLYVDSACGIQVLFPKRSGDYNRITPNGIVPPLPYTLPLVMNSKTLGLEHLVVIAVRAGDGQAVDFSQLAQPTLEKARDMERTRGGNSGLDLPLGRLLQHAMFGQGATRGITPEMTDDYSIQVHSWRIFPEKRPKTPPQRTP